VSIDALTGRELDAAIAARLFGVEVEERSNSRTGEKVVVCRPRQTVGPRCVLQPQHGSVAQRRTGAARPRLDLAGDRPRGTGDWESTETLARCYQQPDDATILAVVEGGVELRERQA
jgi:hypothetical protein